MTFHYRSLTAVFPLESPAFIPILITVVLVVLVVVLVAAAAPAAAAFCTG